MAPIIVVGPPACGKTRHSGNMMQMFRARGVVDDWDFTQHLLSPNCIHLTQMRPGPQWLQRHPRAEIWDFSALRFVKPAFRAEGRLFVRALGRRYG